MKRLCVVVLMVAILGFAFAQDYNKINGNGQLPKDANRTGIQSGRYIRMYDNNPAAYEHVNDGDFTIVTSWTATNDIAVNSLSANWTWADSVVSNLTQPADSLNLAFEAGQYVVLNYTIYDSVAIAGGDVTFTVGGFCETSNISATSGDHTYYITASASAATDLLLFTVKADSNVTAGEFSIDDISIGSYNQSPLTIVNGAEVILTIPDNVVELIFDSHGTDIKLEKYSSSVTINSARAIPCSGVNTITIGNDSGGTATVDFYFSGI